jgi:hypothetical protein
VTRICANCGTEVDDDALFCPTCGQPMQTSARPELPPAPDWPEAPRTSLPPPDVDATEARPAASQPAPPPWQPAAVEQPADAEPAQPDRSEPEVDSRYHADLGPRRETGEVPPWRRGSAHGAGPAGRPPPAVGAPPAPRAQDPFGPSGAITTPDTLASWLAGGGAALAFIALLLPWRTGGTYVAGWGLASAINVVVGLLLLGVMVVIFLSRMVPALPRRDLAFAAFGMLGVGIGLDRLGMPLTGVGATLFLIGMLAVAGGGFVVLLGLDRNVGGPRS